MYPSGELTLLATRKALLRVRIAERRWQCAAAAAELAQPLALADRGIALWRQYSPLVKLVGVPVLLLLSRRFTRGGGKLRTVARLAPLIIRAIRMFLRRRAETAAAEYA